MTFCKLQQTKKGMENMKEYQKLICTVLVLSGGFAASARADGETIAVFTKNQTNPFFQTVRVGADAAAKGLGAKTLHYIPTKPDSIPEQLSQIEDVVVKKPNAIVFTPVDYKAMVPGIEKVNEAGIPVVNITDRSAGGKFLAFVGADDYSLGLDTARYLLKTLGGKGNIVIIEGVKGSLTNVDRVRGFNDALKENPGAKLLASQPGNYQRLQALQVMENLMQSNSQIDGVLAANDAMAVGAIEALDGANRKAQVIGINGTKEAVDAIKSGKLLASGDYNGFVQGCVGTMIAIRSLRRQPVVTEIVLKPTIITRDNYQPYDVPLESRTCPSWDEAAKLGTK
jgi:ribose transport system substrate-binding protein